MPTESMEVFQQYLPLIKNIALALAIFIIGWMVSKAVARLVVRSLSRGSIDVALSRFLGNIARYAVLAATVIAALGKVGVETTSLVAIFASAGLAVGLALQGTLANFASGVMILFFRPFSLDEVVTVAGSTGKVQDIGLFATTLMSPDNQKIIVPNAKVTGDTITNISGQLRRRGAVSVGVAYGTDLAQAEQILVKAASRVSGVLSDPAPAVVLTGLGASSVDFEVRAWAENADFFPMMHALTAAIYDDLNAAKIEIPFNQIVVHQTAA